MRRELRLNARRITIGLLALSTTVAATAQTVYRWTDEAGHVHFSDVVPEAYKKVARPMDLQVVEPSPADKAEADARAAAQKAAADRLVPLPSDPATDAPSAVARTTGAFQYTASNCKAWRQRYSQSKACFDGFAGADDRPMQAGAQNCGEDVPNPYPVCGAPENYEIDPRDQPWISLPPHHRH